MWGGRESMTCEITSYHRDEDEEDKEEEEEVVQGRVFNYEDGDGQPDKPLMLIRSYTGLQH